MLAPVIRSFALADGGSVELHERWLEAGAAAELFILLRDQIAWKTEPIRVRGREYLQPRLTAWFSDPDATYTYSGLTLVPRPWPAALAHLRARVEASAGAPFNSVLCNFYRDGADSMGLHADAEPELGKNPIVASVSLGATRRFVLRHVKDPREKLDLDLAGGSLLVMRGTTQHFYRHGVPKRLCVVEGRINLTFRRIFQPA
jgi:alkylated DNA repair dioxygenase AlkB